MEVKYHQQPTLIIGLGGFGSCIADHVYSQVKDKRNVSAFCIDTDLYAVKTLKSIPENHFINISMTTSVSDALSHFADSTDWFPRHPMLKQKTLSEGAGQVRAVSRLAYENALRSNRFGKLLDDTYKMAKECVASNCRMRVSIVTSLVGGTGAGIFIQVALLVRKCIAEYFPTLNVKIQGEFIMPSNFLFIPSTAEKRNMEAITYASLKELNAINEHFFSNAPAIELKYDWKNDSYGENNIVDSLPYDYCFLYDRINKGTNFDGTYIENAIIERLFGNSATALNDAFVNGLRTSVRKRSGNLYGIIHSETISNNASLLDSEIYCSIINRLNQNNGRQIFVVTSPQSLHIDLSQLPKDAVLVEIIDKKAEKTTITEMNYGIEISTIEKLKYQTGQYYLSYKIIVDNLPHGITPHLNTKWHTEMVDIGSDNNSNVSTCTSIPYPHKIPKESFVFISYSTRDSDIAEQTKRILEANEIPCWMAPQSIPAGSDYGAEIPKAIDSCKVFLLLLSKASQESNWVPKEVGLAIGKGKVVVPFQIDNAVISDSFNFYLTNSQRISAYNRMTDAYQELIKRLIDLLTPLFHYQSVTR